MSTLSEAMDGHFTIGFHTNRSGRQNFRIGCSSCNSESDSRHIPATTNIRTVIVFKGCSCADVLCFCFSHLQIHLIPWFLALNFIFKKQREIEILPKTEIFFLHKQKNICFIYLT
jgi:hypothetical protein